jgi:hypothetical protein
MEQQSDETQNRSWKANDPGLPEAPNIIPWVMRGMLLVDHQVR